MALLHISVIIVNLKPSFALQITSFMMQVLIKNKHNNLEIISWFYQKKFNCKYFYSKPQVLSEETVQYYLVSSFCGFETKLCCDWIQILESNALLVLISDDILAILGHFYNKKS